MMLSLLGTQETMASFLERQLLHYISQYGVHTAMQGYR